MRIGAQRRYFSPMTKHQLVHHGQTAGPAMLLAVEGGLLLVFAAMAILINTLDHSLIISGLDLAVILASLLGLVTALRMRQPHVKLAGLFLITMVAATAHLFWYSGAAIMLLAMAALLTVADAVGTIALILLPRRFRRDI